MEEEITRKRNLPVKKEPRRGNSYLPQKKNTRCRQQECSLFSLFDFYAFAVFAFRDLLAFRFTVSSASFTPAASVFPVRFLFGFSSAGFSSAGFPDFIFPFSDPAVLTFVFCFAFSLLRRFSYRWYSLSARPAMISSPSTRSFQ